MSTATSPLHHCALRRSPPRPPAPPRSPVIALTDPLRRRVLRPRPRHQKLYPQVASCRTTNSLAYRNSLCANNFAFSSTSGFVIVLALQHPHPPKESRIKPISHTPAASTFTTRSEHILFPDPSANFTSTPRNSLRRPENLFRHPFLSAHRNSQWRSPKRFRN